MKKKIMSLMMMLVLIVTCGFYLTACKNKEVWTFPKRITLALSDKLHVEYENYSIKGFSTLPGYCVLVKDGDSYYVKTPTTYSSNRLEVYEKINLKNAVEFSGESYGQGYISARWDDYSNTWVSAADDVNTSPANPQWHANDQNNHVYSVGIAFLDAGYDDINHIYENGVTNQYGSKYTATQKTNETLTIGSNQVECEVWEYEEYHGEDNWEKCKYWFEKETKVILKQSTIYASSTNKNLDADENVGFRATYFSKTETMQSYLSSVGRSPAPNFSNYR